MTTVRLNLARMRLVVTFLLAAAFWPVAHGYTSIIPNKAWHSDIQCSSRDETTIWGEVDTGWGGVRDGVIDHLNSHDCHVKANGVDVVNHFFADECKVNPDTPGAGKLGRVHCTGHIFHECLRGCTSWTTPDWGFYIWKDCGEGNVFDSADEQCHCYSRTTRLFFPPENACVSYADRYHAPETCPRVGNPILPSSGVKLQFETGTQLAGAGLTLAYNSRSIMPMPGSEPMGKWEPKPFGEQWGSNLHKRLRRLVGTRGAVVADRGSTVVESFEYAGQSGYDPTYQATRPQTGLSLTKISTGYRLVDSLGLVVEEYDSNTLPDANATFDRIKSASFADGRKLTHQYSTGVVAGVSPEEGLLISVTDTFGRQTRLFYERPAGIAHSRVYKIVGPDDQQILLGYDAFNTLSSLTWPGDPVKVKAYLYEIPELPGALTGVVDEDGQRYGTYSYDSDGRARSTEHGSGFDKHVANWSEPPDWNIVETFDEVARVIWRDHYWRPPQNLTITDPLNQASALGVSLVNGEPRLKTRSQPGGSGCEASSNRMEYDSRSNVKLRVDFTGQATCYAHDSLRPLETFRIEGWPAAETERCLTEDLANYQVPEVQQPQTPQRKITTTWHPKWKLEARRAEPHRITTTVYNGQYDPVAKVTPPDCTGGAPDLPGGGKIAVVCRRYEQATTDATGNQGFNATVTETRSWNYTYNPYGQLKSETDPRGKLTSYDYWPDTLFNGTDSHWLGDLKTVTNALGQATQYLEYNKRGQPLKIQQPNGSTEQREYHARGLLIKVMLTPAGGGTTQLTQYDYFDTGLLRRATQPDGSFAEYTWDDAHRLTDVADSAGNSVHYELDNAGNRTAEQYKDPNQVLAKTISRTFDALGRVNTSTGAP